MKIIALYAYLCSVFQEKSQNSMDEIPMIQFLSDLKSFGEDMEDGLRDEDSLSMMWERIQEKFEAIKNLPTPVEVER